MEILVEKTNNFCAEIEVNPDKSLTHRAFLISLLTKDQNFKIVNFSNAKDCLTSLKAIQKLGCKVKIFEKNKILIQSPTTLNSNIEIDCENSGTTARLLIGILSSVEVEKGAKFVLKGDKSLLQRPMKRVIEPLELMGAKILHNNFTLPVEITPQKLYQIEYKSKIASAQVKSAILFAGLNCQNKNTPTIFNEPFQSRNHTENLLKLFNAKIETQNLKTSLFPSNLEAKEVEIEGDFSSAAFFISAAILCQNSSLIIKNVNLNPTRTMFLEILKKMGAKIEIKNTNCKNFEPFGDLFIESSDLKAIEIEPSLVPALIDELPILGLVFSQADGVSVVKGAEELKYKESNRILAICENLKKLGAKIEPTHDGFIVAGKTKLKGNVVLQGFNDHRILMTNFISGLICEKPIKIKDFEWVDISFPNFLKISKNIFNYSII